MNLFSAKKSSTLRRHLPSLAVLAMLGLAASCRSAPQPCPEKVGDPEVRLQKRAVELVPLIVTSPSLSPKELNFLRGSFAQQIMDSGVFVLAKEGESADFVIAGTLSDVGQLPSLRDQSLGVAMDENDTGDWSVRAVFELRAKADNHLISVVGASHTAEVTVQQSTGEQAPAAIADPRMRRAMLQVLRQTAANLAVRFGPGARFPDPVSLDDSSLIALGRKRYAEGAYFDAEALLRTLRERHPDEAKYASWLGDIYYSRRDYPEAVRLYNAAIDLEPGRFHDLVLLGNAAFFLRDHQRARKVWRQALRLDPKGPGAKLLRANLRKLSATRAKPARGRGLQNPTGASRPGDTSQLAGDEF